jgi:UDP-N-acetyl-D-mannosaminuronate dehydrogenase
MRMLEYIYRAVNIAKYNEILNQSARGKLYIHLWNYTKSYYILVSQSING